MANKKKKSKKLLYAAIGGMASGFAIMIACAWMFEKTSTNESCMSCHIHPEAENSWKQSVHFNNGSGVTTNCVECHLPPRGTMAYYTAKAKTGLKDLWS